MAVVIPDDYAQVTLNWSHSESERQWSTVLGVQASASTANEVGDNVIAAWTNELRQAMDTSISLATVTVRMGPSSGPDQGISLEMPVNVAGLEAMTGAPSNCTVLVRKLTAFGGRANRGRNFWPGMIADGNVDEVGRLDESHQDYLQVRFVDFFAALGSGNGGTGALTPAVILHDEESPSTDPRLVSAVSVERLIGTQRRRVRP